MSISQVADLGNNKVIYEKSELEDFLPIDVDTLELSDYAKNMKTLADFVRIDEGLDQRMKDGQSAQEIAKKSKFFNNFLQFF